MRTRASPAAADADARGRRVAIEAGASASLARTIGTACHLGRDVPRAVRDDWAKRYARERPSVPRGWLARVNVALPLYRRFHKSVEGDGNPAGATRYRYYAHTLGYVSGSAGYGDAISGYSFRRQPRLINLGSESVRAEVLHALKQERLKRPRTSRAFPAAALSPSQLMSPNFQYSGGFQNNQTHDELLRVFGETTDGTYKRDNRRTSDDLAGSEEIVLWRPGCLLRQGRRLL